MSEDSQTSGVVASGFLHAALLAFIVYGFASAPQFDDATESIAVDTVTKEQFNQIMKGDRPAPPQPPVKPQAPLPPEPPPELRKAEETPPPEPPKPEPPKPEPPKAPEPSKPEPPPPPKLEPTKPEPPKLEPPIPPQKPSTPPEPPRPEPPLPPRPEPTRAQPPVPPPKPPKPEAQETPPPKPKVPEMPPERPKEVQQEKPKPDQLAKLIAKDKSDEPPKDAKPSAKPYDPKAISKLLGESKPTTPSAAPANAGAPTARAQRMSGSQERALDEWFKDAYMACWSPPPTMPEGDPYIPQIRVEFNADGTLSGEPVLVNPPPDPVWRAHADSAKRAALRCNPLKVPPQYAPFFDQWRSKTIHFDPREALG